MHDTRFVMLDARCGMRDFYSKLAVWWHLIRVKLRNGKVDKRILPC
ncbi:MAG TPA: hypothetical protein VJ440_01120 [Candidatus Brocadiaceae bacterium]|nr:hypothetical protein [Candidatus Brocadiaceae bacterium]